MSGFETPDEAKRRIESPCVGICVVDPETDRCEGCDRTLDEVAAWSTSSAAQRREIIAAVQRRRERAQHGGDARRHDGPVPGVPGGPVPGATA